MVISGETQSLTDTPSRRLPEAYASFLATPGDEDEKARLRQEAVATVRAFQRRP